MLEMQLSNSILSVLATLRLLKSTPERSISSGHSAMHFMEVWSGGGLVGPDACRLAAILMENFVEAKTAVNASQLNDEAKSGLVQTIDGLINAFSLPGMNQQILQYIPQLDASITNFALLLSMSSDEGKSQAAKKLAQELAAEIRGFAEDVALSELPSQIRDLLIRHLRIAAIMLENLEVFGIESASASYAEMIIRLKSEVRKSQSHEPVEPAMWEKVKGLMEKFNLIADTLDKGVILLSYAEKAGSFIKLLT